MVEGVTVVGITLYERRSRLRGDRDDVVAGRGVGRLGWLASPSRGMSFKEKLRHSCWDPIKRLGVTDRRKINQKTKRTPVGFFTCIFEIANQNTVLIIICIV